MPYKNFKNIEIFDLNKLVSGVTLSQHRASPVTKRRHQTPSTQGGGQSGRGQGRTAMRKTPTHAPAKAPASASRHSLTKNTRQGSVAWPAVWKPIIPGGPLRRPCSV